MNQASPAGRCLRRAMRTPLAARGFTLVELMVVVAVLGVLAAIAIPNFFAASNRAKEASLKANMHAVQFVAEDFLIKGDSTYAASITELVPQLKVDFVNAFDNSVGAGNAWEDRASVNGDPTPKPGITSYADSLGQFYNVKGYGAKSTLNLVLTSGR